MDATTTTLPHQLRTALEASGLTPIRAHHITQKMPPAGQHALLTALTRDPQNTFTKLLHAFVGDVADLLRVTHADANTVRRAFRTAIVR